MQQQRAGWHMQHPLCRVGVAACSPQGAVEDTVLQVECLSRLPPATHKGGAESTVAENAVGQKTPWHRRHRRAEDSMGWKTLWGRDSVVYKALRVRRLGYNTACCRQSGLSASFGDTRGKAGSPLPEDRPPVPKATMSQIQVMGE